MEQTRIKHNETGRSMVEMLGVLAVVGVLSIGGVAGYRYAVDKMNANEIINELKKRAITASQQRVLGQNVNLAEYGNILGKYAVDIPADGYPNNPSAFALEVKGIPEGVCNHILRSDWALPVEKKVGGTVVNNDTSCSDGANILTFAFNNTLGSGDAGNAETTVEQKNCSGKGTWNGSYCECNEGFGGEDCSETRNPEECNGHGKIWNSYYCFCDHGWYGEGYEGQCSERKDVCNGHGIWNGCGCLCDRGWSSDGWGNWCTIQSDNCNGHGRLNDFGSERYCICDSGWSGEDCSLEGITTETTTVTDNVYQICDPSGHCTPCSDTSVQGVPFSDKEMCENKCNSTGYTWIYHGEYDYDGSQKGNVCSPCLGPISDIEDNIEAVCARCNRGVDWTTQYGNTYQCAPVGSGSIGSNPNATATETVTETVTVTETETEQGMRDEYGYFHSCSETGYFSVNDTSECSKCEGSGYLWGVMGYNCVSCQGNYISDTEDDIEALCAQCNKGVDWANGWGSNPKYYACSSTSAHNGEKPAKDCFNVERTKECVPCDSLEGVGADDSPNCSACGELRTSRSGNCFLTTCPAGYIHAGSVFASNGSVLFDNYTSCVPCPTVGTRVFVSDLVDTFGAECQACNGRLDGSYCYME